MNIRMRRSVRNSTILIDILIFNLAFILAYYVRYELEWLRPVEYYLSYIEYVPQQLLLTALLAVTFSFNRVWRRRRGEFLIDELSRTFYASATAIVLLMAITFYFRPLAFSRLMLVWILFFIYVLVGISRLTRRAILNYYYRRGIGTDRAIIVGAGEVARGVIRTLLARPDLGFQAIGYLDDGLNENVIGSGRIPNLGNWRELEEVIQSHPRLSTAFIAMPHEMHGELASMLSICQRQGVRAQVVPDLLQLSLNHVEFNNMAGVPMLGIREVQVSRFQQAIKRLVDLCIVMIGTIPTLAVGAVIAIAIKLDSPGPIFYAQERVGQGGKHFKFYKFRSMVTDADAQKEGLMALNEASGPIFKIKEDPRLTRVGRIIRRLSLDELPQIYNVVRGDMSLVGPRPPLPKEVEAYQAWHLQRLAIRGGITGLWQVSGRSDLTFDEQALLDIYYIEKWSLALDLRILLQTIPFTLFARGAY